MHTDPHLPKQYEGKQPLISVIIPVYNVEPYLRQCLDSVVNQTYTNLEILVVNDGSTDNSLAICEEFANKDPRIKVFSQENGGQSKARNTGLRHATGYYLTFVDSDDWITLDCYQSCVDYLQTYPDTDIVEFGVTDGTSTYIPTGQRLNQSDLLFAYTNRRGVQAAPWNKVYRASLVDEVIFPEGRKYEDISFLLLFYMRIKSYGSIPKQFYHYRRNVPNQTTSGISPKYLDAFYNINEDVKTIASTYPEHLAVANTLLVYILMYPDYPIWSDKQLRSEYAPKLLPYIREARKRPFLGLSRINWLRRWLFLHFPLLAYRIR